MGPGEDFHCHHVRDNHHGRHGLHCHLGHNDDYGHHGRHGHQDKQVRDDRQNRQESLTVLIGQTDLTFQIDFPGNLCTV